MRKIYLFAFLALLGYASIAQVTVSRTSTVYAGSSPFQDSMWTFKSTDYSIVKRFAPTSAGHTITGIVGLATDPTTGINYALLKESGVGNRVLATINPQTGVCTDIGSTGDKFSTICFNANGTLYGVTGNGATVPETMYKINKTTGARTLLAPLGAGADGEIISFCTDNNKFYHWSGNGSVVWERMDTNATIQSLGYSGLPGGETFGALYLGNGQFLTSNIASHFKIWDTLGNISGDLSNNPDDIRGLVRETYTTSISTSAGTSICTGGSVTLTVSAGTSGYQWYLNGAAIGGANSISYVATAAGVYNCVYTDQNGITDSTGTGITVTVSAPPTIGASATGGGCSGSATLTATGGTTYTWAPPTSLSATTGSSVVASPTSLTVYTVTGTTGGSGCSGTATVTVNPVSSTGVSFDHGSPQSMLVCASSVAVPLNVQLAATATGTVTLTYTVISAPTHGTLTGFPASVAGGTSVYPSAPKYQPTYGYTGADAFVIRVSNGTCFVQTTVNVTVSGAMPALINVTGGGGYCAGGAGLNVGISGSATGVSYQLFRGASPVGTPAAGIGMALSFGLQTLAGTYTVMAINGTTGCMAPATGSATITVYPLPTVYSVTGGGGYCTGGTGVHIGISGSTSGVTYKLYNGGPVLATTTGTGAARDFGLFTAAGTYTVTATAPTTACVIAMSGSAPVSVNPNPSVTGSSYVVAPGGSTTLTGSIGGGSWTSSNPGVASIGSSTGVVTGVALGTTVMTYTLPTGCYGVHIFYVTATGHKASGSLEPGEAPTALAVAPNPNNGTFTLSGNVGTADEQQVQVQVTNLLGQRVYAHAFTVLNGDMQEAIDLGGQPNGLYILTLQAGNETRTIRIAVQR